MAKEIKIGERVLDYMFELIEIQATIQETYNYAVNCVGLLADESTYQGKAKEEMKLFCDSLAEHLAGMISLYQAASTYICTAYQTFYYNEEQLVAWLNSHLGEGWPNG